MSRTKRVLVLVAIVIVLWLGYRRYSTFPQTYVNTRVGISVNFPSNWRIRLIERSGMIILNPRLRLFPWNSATITILSGWEKDPATPTLEETLRSQVKRLNSSFFKLEEIHYLRPIEVSEALGMARTTIRVPTMALPQPGQMNHMGRRKPDVFQVIDIYVFENSPDYYTAVEVDRGRNESTNAQADEIVSSMRFSEPNFDEPVD